MFEDSKKIKELIDLLESSKLKKLSIKNKDEEIVLEKEDSYASSHLQPIERALPPEKKEKGVEKEPTPSISSDKNLVTSPMVGTFYASPGPNQPPFVAVGDMVTEESVVCIIEAMKVMNEVKAGKSGKVLEILAKDMQPVEFGTKLFHIE